MRKSKHFRYGHVFFVDELKFNARIAQLVCAPENGLNAGEHLFITAYPKVFNGIRQYTENVVLAEVANPCSAEVINRYAPHCDWLIVHSMLQPHEALKIKNKYRSKIIWRTWGHDVGYKQVEGQWLKNAVRRFFKLLWKFEVRQFHAVGIANVVDKLVLTKTFGPLNLYPISYSLRDHRDNLRKAEALSHKETDTINILIGHSGAPEDNHIELLKKLEKFKNENIHLTFILSYGDPTHIYINKVVDYVNAHWSDQSTLITEMMSYDKYVALLASMDIVLLDGLHSNALGNISTLLYFKKKIFLNPEGVLYEAFCAENVPCGRSDTISDMSFAELVAPVAYTGTECSMIACTYEEGVNRWRVLLGDLEKIE